MSILISRRALVGAGATFPFLAAAGHAQAPSGVLRYGLTACPPNLQPWVRPERRPAR